MHNLESNYRVPKFNSFTVLRSHDLKSLNKNIENATFLGYENLEDGIINGLDTITDGEKIYVSKGIYKFENKIYCLEENVYIDIPVNEGSYSLKLIVEEKEEEYEIIKKMYLSYLEEKGILLVKFHIRNGVKLENSEYKLYKFD